MKTTFKDYGCVATITEKADGTARLVIKDQLGKKVKESNHKSKNAAVSAWRRWCN